MGQSIKVKAEGLRINKGNVEGNRSGAKSNKEMAVSNRWTGLLEWTTGMDFDLFFFFLSLPRANYIH